MAEQQKKKYQEQHPNGIYRVKVLAQKLATSAADNTYLKLKVEVLSLKKAEQGSPTIITGGHRFVDVHFTDKTIEKSKAFLVAGGFTARTVAALDPDHSEHANGGSIVGFEFDATNKLEQSNSKDPKYAGKWQDKFSALPVGNGNNTKWMEKLKTPSQRSLMQLDAIFGSVSVPSVGEIAKGPVNQPAPANQQVSSSEPPPGFGQFADDDPNSAW